jgi:hypothetical protein
MAPRENYGWKFVKALGGMVLSSFLGIVGGGVCGAIILSFGDLIGRSGDTGEEYVGSWSVSTLWLGWLYGSIFGAFVGLLAYPLVRSIGFRKAILPAFVGTLVGGFAGSIGAPPLAMLTGIFGFFVALIWKRYSLAVANIKNSFAN